jgi:hypothetical protein
MLRSVEITARDAVGLRGNVMLTSSFDAAVSTLNMCIVFCFRGLKRQLSYTKHRPATKLKDKKSHCNVDVHSHCRPNLGVR